MLVALNNQQSKYVLDIRWCFRCIPQSSIFKRTNAQQDWKCKFILYFLNGCTCKDALVLEARQEGQGIYTTCQSLCHHFNPRAPGSLLFCACAAEIGWVLPLAELPILIPGTYIRTRYPSQDDASLHLTCGEPKTPTALKLNVEVFGPLINPYWLKEATTAIKVLQSSRNI